MSETPEMIERVARALYAIRMEVAESTGIHEPYTWETDNNAYREHCLREARAAIQAMREPTLVLESGWTKWDGGPCPFPDGEVIEFRRRNGEFIRHSFPNDFNWGRYNVEMPTDIIAYKRAPNQNESLTQDANNAS
jgi:hypothetical protein